jgi:cytoskeletal protein RodZ
MSVTEGTGSTGVPPDGQYYVTEAQEEKWIERSIIRFMAYWALAFPATILIWTLWWWVNIFPW